MIKAMEKAVQSGPTIVYICILKNLNTETYMFTMDLKICVGHNSGCWLHWVLATEFGV